MEGEEDIINKMVRESFERLAKLLEDCMDKTIETGKMLYIVPIAKNHPKIIEYLESRFELRKLFDPSNEEELWYIGAVRRK